MSYTLTYSYANNAYSVTGYTGTPIDVVIPNTYNDGTNGEHPVTVIGDGAFAYCSSLTSIEIPDSVTSIGDGAFYRCTSLTSVIIGNGVTSIGNHAFYECSSLTSVIIPDSVTSIGNYAFYRCSSLTSVIIGNGVTSIGNHAFYECSSLTSIEIPDSVTSISYNVFIGCTSLTSVIIGNGVTSIGDGAFYRCSSLTSVLLFPITVPSLASYVFTDTAEDIHFYCFSKSLDAYKSAAGWNIYADKIIADDLRIYFTANANSTKKYIDSADSIKVDKVSTPDRIYGTDANGNQTTYDADLISGLQSEITAQNPLSADLVDDTNTKNGFVVRVLPNDYIHSVIKSGYHIYIVCSGEQVQNVLACYVNIIEDEWGGTYEITATDLKTGKTISVNDIYWGETISNLVTSINTNGTKLGTDNFTDANNSNKFVTASEKATWNGKQDALTFDNSPVQNSSNPVKSGGVYNAIREYSLPLTTRYGASLLLAFNSADGILTVQLKDQNGNNLGSAQTVTIDLQSIESAIDAIESLIPAQASAENQLADKNFVNSTVATNTANFCGTYNLVTDLGLTSSATESQIATALAAKLSSLGITVTNNDYAYVAYPNASEPTQFDRYDRYKYSSATSEWGYEFTLNNSSFTAAQWAAINSLITAAKVTAYDTHIADKNNPHEVTKSQVGLGNVDNTSDLNKPISTATQTALDGKQDKIDGTHKLSADIIEDGTTNKVFTATEQSKLSGIEAGAEVNDVDSVNGQTGTVVLDADDISDTNTTNKFVTASEKTTWDNKQDAVPTITLTQSMITGYGGYDYPNTTNSNDWIRFNIGQANQYLVSDNYDTIKLDIRQIKALLNLPTDYVWIKRNATNSQDNNGTTITLYQFFASYDGFEYEGLLDPTNPYVAILQNGSAGFIYSSDYGLAWLTFRNFNITDIYSRISVLETGKQGKLTFDSTPTAGSNNPVTSAGIKTAIDTAISSVYRFKGSVATYADLPSTGLNEGDVYNVLDTDRNYAWTGSTWDALGGTVDLSNYVPTSRTIAGNALTGDISAQTLTDSLVYMNATTDLDDIFAD